MKVKFLAISDIHINDWCLSYEYAGNRLEDSLMPLRIVQERAKEIGACVLFGGDLFHRPKSLDNNVIEAFLKIPLYQRMVGIDGNHDQSKSNTHKNKSKGYFHNFAGVVELMTSVNYEPCGIGNYLIHGIPYMKNNVGFKTYLKLAHKRRLKNPNMKHILLIHTDLPGAVKENGIVAEKAENIKSLKIFKGFDLVLCGHIHTPQILAPKIVMMGSPYQQNVGEMGQKRGYWEIYEDLSYKFIPITTIPTYQFRDDDNPTVDSSKYILVPRPPKSQEVSEDGLSKFSINQSRKDIAKAYLNVSKEKNKRRRNLLLKLINKTT